jgi:crotonobetainyl-CoA:carnitine CoA-transferase CaiB-like acyl-CoA transferase
MNDRVGYDAVLQAESGFMSMNGEQDGPPIKMPVALIDVLAAHQLKEGLLVALLKRERTGDGCLVDVSLIDSAIASLVNQASNWLVGGNVPVRKGSLHPNIAPYGEWFETSDGKKILLAVGSDRQFKDLCELLEIDNRFKTNTDRVRNRKELAEIISSKISKLSSDQFMGRINRLKIPAGIIQDVKEVFDMPEANELLISADGLKGVRSFVANFKLQASNFQHQASDIRLTAPPHLGEHTEEILASLR